ncbi:MAG: HD domain-containing protein [Dehalococcoidia bacterium]|nr:MAG: HD domain-containing protein [Dehalococcoidia bacterium]
MGTSNRKSKSPKSAKSAATGPGNESTGKTAILQNTGCQDDVLKGIIDRSNIAIFSVDRDYHYLDYNNSHISMMQSIYGVTITPGKSLLDCITVQEDREKARANLDRALLKSERVYEENYSGDKSLTRSCFEFYYNPIINTSGDVNAVLVIARDITERKLMEEQLQSLAHDLRNRNKELNCLYGLSKLIEEKGDSTDYVFQGTVELIPNAWQYPEIVCARLTIENKEFNTPNWKETRIKQVADIRVQGFPAGRLEICYLEQPPKNNGEPFLQEERDLANAIVQRLGRMIERKRAEETFLSSKLLMQNVIDATPDFIYVKDLEHKFLLVNRSFAQSQNLTPQDMIGRPDTDFFSEELCLGNPEKGITGFHADDEEAFHGHLVQNPGNVVTWADGSEHIYDTFKIPLADKSGIIYAAIVFSRISIERSLAEEGTEALISALQQRLQSVVDTISKVVEMRDPNTAGHQRRTAALAAAIAREMKLEESNIEELTLAAKIHDIGKIYVPSDILVKSGKLTDNELSMIITHAQGSYDILWKSKFSERVALMVLQHHERIDGSGYPNELKGEETLIESKILAVADVVEAISSNRPYRQAFGEDRALEEITRNRGKLYDPEVVDACLKLFNEKRFQFEDVFVTP